MVDLYIGRHGVVILVVLFVLLTIEDLFIWINRGVVPGVEFFLGALIVVVIAAAAVHEAMTHPPPPGI